MGGAGGLPDRRSDGAALRVRRTGEAIPFVIATLIAVNIGWLRSEADCTEQRP